MKKFEENLIFEQSVPGRVGVDIVIDNDNDLMINQTPRIKIGLPEVSEPQVVRHFVNLSKLNYSIDSNIYPLGSCTMKHNPRINEKLARLDGFTNIHPEQNFEDVQGALEIMYDLQNYLAKISDLPKVCLNPAAGAHGEFAGIMTIKKAHEYYNRNKKYILIPDSAHGTNPATAAICGFKIKTLKSDEHGIVCLDDFMSKIDDDVAGMMLTNPNTCGVFEKNIKIMADELHKRDAYLYCDGANFNAIMGKVSPAKCGIDVMHFNLHKTFSTPHGGGGPGSGPIAVSEELYPFVPQPVVIKKQGQFILTNNEHSFGRIKGFHGQFGMFVRALAYIKSYGIVGLKQVAEDAVLNANYILHHLKDYYDVPFEGYCMHECLLTDKQQQQQSSKISTLEIAKTLVEFGYHPMTVYFPLVVKGAMLIEPTENETRESLDNYINIMQKISLYSVENASKLKEYPVSTPRKRCDELKAAKNPVLTYQDE